VARALPRPHWRSLQRSRDPLAKFVKKAPGKETWKGKIRREKWMRKMKEGRGKEDQGNLLPA